MNLLQNLHTHTTYCDGKNTPEEMILAACEKGFGSIGFSGHSYTYYHPGLCMTPEGTLEYKQEVARLKEKYADKIEVFCGLEFDMYSTAGKSDYDYLIGSVHYISIQDEPIGFDRSADVVKGVINQYFNGDGMAYAKAYYKTLSKLPEYGDFDIIGHFDLITKHKEREHFFDTDSTEYQRAAIEAAEALSGKIPYFEVNTGAIARGYRTSPYPDPFIIKEMKRLGFGAVISSDCHNSKDLDCGFDLARKLLKECGFKEHYLLTADGFVPAEL